MQQQDIEVHAPMLAWDDIHALLQAEEAPCVSIYVPTSPTSSYREENRIRYKDQMNKVSAGLADADIDKRVRAELTDALQTIGTTDLFWTHQQYGLAVFVSQQRFMVRRMMSRPKLPLGIVADSFHLRPALREAANWMRYQVLCVSLQEVALYDCTREHMTAVQLHEDVPREMGDVINQTETSTNRKDFERSGQDSADLKRYFHGIDRAIVEHHNGRTSPPLILAAVSEYQGLFREASDNPDLLDLGVEKQPFEELRQHRLGEESWAVAEQALREEGDRWVRRFRASQARDEATSALDAVARAAVVGRVETLLIDESARVEGAVDPHTGAVEYGAAGDAHTDDVLDAIAGHVLRHDGAVRFLPGDRMPGDSGDSGVAAILRYATPAR